MKIAVGSKNPVKIKAVENVVRKIWPGAEVIGVEVAHNANNQPKTDEEAIKGATDRALLSLQEADADFGFGLEGNTVDTNHGMLLSGWVVAVDKHGKRGIACSGSLLLPNKIAAEIRRGGEVGPVTDKMFGHDNIKQKEGTVGMLTNNMVTRTEAFEKGVIFALAPFLNPHYYN